jgi:hypothetical protein
VLTALSTGSGSLSGGSGAGAGTAGRYFNNTELNELFSIVRGKNPFGDGARKGAAAGALLGPPPTNRDSFSGLPEHLQQLPPIRTRAADGNPLAPETVIGPGPKTNARHWSIKSTQHVNYNFHCDQGHSACHTP